MEKTRKVLLNYRPPNGHLECLKEAAPSYRFYWTQDQQKSIELVEDTEVMMGNRFFLQCLPFAKKLKWFQSNSVGMDLVFSSSLAQDSSFIITNAKGVYDDEMADHTLGLILAMLRDLPTIFSDQAHRQWNRRTLGHLKGKKVLIFGYGGVGQAIGHRLYACGAVCQGVQKHVNTELQAQSSSIPLFNLRDGVKRLPQADIVVLTLPLTPETKGIFCEKTLTNCKDGAYLVNISRGGILEEQALKQLLPKFSGVALDVFEKEPLDSTSWLWNHPKVLISPHLARSKEPDPPLWINLFETNFKRWVSGKKLLNIVDKELRY